jgi:hypothetical protein
MSNRQFRHFCSAQRALLFLAFPVVAAGYVVACSQTPPAPPSVGLKVVITTDLKPTEFDHLRVQVSQEDPANDASDWRTLLDEEKAVPLPTTFFIRPGDSGNDMVRIDVTALLLGQPVVFREIEANVPTDRLSEVDIELAEPITPSSAGLDATTDGQPESSTGTPMDSSVSSATADTSAAVERVDASFDASVDVAMSDAVVPGANDAAAEANVGGDGGPPVVACMWRQTGQCSATGPREPQNDEPCSVPIGSGSSGYCECPTADGAAADVGTNCSHGQATCDYVCSAGAWPVAPETSDAAPADTGAGDFCASLSPQPLLCDDFDEHALPDIWPEFNQVGGTLSLDSTAFLSPPNSLSIMSDPLSSGQSYDTSLRRVFPLASPPNAVSLAFSLQSVSADPALNDAIVIVALDFLDADTDRYTVQITLFQEGIGLGLRLEEQARFRDGTSSYMTQPLPDSITAETWTDVRLVVTRASPTAASARVTFNGATEIDTPLVLSVAATSVQVDIGSSFETEPSAGWTNRYDNVVFDIQ